MSIAERLTRLGVLCPSSPLIWLLYALKNIQAKKIFLITPQNETTLQRKEINKRT